MALTALEQWELTLKTALDSIDALLEKKYGPLLVRKASRPAAGKASNPKYDGVFGIDSKFTLGYASGSGPGYIIELLSGCAVRNLNRAANMLRGKLYVCPVCGNVIRAAGDAVVSCCGITLPPLEAEEPDQEHQILMEPVEDEYFVSVPHPMEKEHNISFLMAVSDQGYQFVKLYPEGNAEARFKMSRVKAVYAYCNRHGLFCVKAGGRKEKEAK